ncbi:peptidase [Nisaea acidiphila]|uniref:Peptidase n=1 Tax=Nisaea acidiphila TaxID=1862145 RepID=A0A9J7APT2_9PROT|nr:imelysin family protein [Nisaea acidiphila]UUX48601.1 peptidase [Nisaea acidiphila]
MSKKVFVNMAIAAISIAGALTAFPADANDSGAKKAVLATYADIAAAGYGDSLAGAKSLQSAVSTLIAAPTEANLAVARTAWIAAREPYQQTEAYRFGNAIVDDWEGKVNAWPLDEGLIDYVKADVYGSESDANPYYTANVVANPSVNIGGKTIDASKIDRALVESLHEIDEIEANVSTGYHAIEFLLWGQDLNGTGPGAGDRKASDFDTANCTNGNCARRAAYLTVATGMLVDELEWMTAQWTEGGAARTGLLEGDADKGIATILTGMGSLSYGELAGERMKLGLMLHDPEEEHDCFSDNTHRSHYNDALGIRNVYLGEYKRTNGTMVKGESLSALVAAKDSAADEELRAALDITMNKMTVLSDEAGNGQSYDQMLAEGNARGNEIVQAAVDALTAQTESIERVVAALGLSALEFEGSDSLDNPGAVFQ